MRLFAVKDDLLVCSIVLASILGGLPAEADVQGKPTIVDGDSLILGGQRFDLFGIDSPEPGTSCLKENGTRFDCGRIATTALLDLTAGMEVKCQPKGPAEHPATEAIPALCTAGGFSLNRNMVHTGWAIADQAVSSDYVDTERKAKEAKRGLWRWEMRSPPWP